MIINLIFDPKLSNEISSRLFLLFIRYIIQLVQSYTHGYTNINYEKFTKTGGGGVQGAEHSPDRDMLVP